MTQRQAEKKPRPNQVGIMKAKPLTNRLLGALGATCLAQRKLRGQRCRTSWVNNQPILLSSYGIPFQFLQHIQAALSTLPPLSYDGELYHHHPDFTQEYINSILNRTTNPHPDVKLIHYHIFDIASPDPQWLRIMNRDMALVSVANDLTSPIRCEPTRLIQTQSWLQHCSKYISEGYEGIILRNQHLVYHPLSNLSRAQRPSGLLKFKPRRKDSYKIMGVKEGTGWAKGMLGSFLVQGEDGNTFSVGTGAELTKAKRIHYWGIREKLIGANLIVKHELTSTRNSIPICTSAYRVEQID